MANCLNYIYPWIEKTQEVERDLISKEVVGIFEVFIANPLSLFYQAELKGFAFDVFIWNFVKTFDLSLTLA